MRVVVLVALAVILGVGALLVGALSIALSTDRGNDFVRRRIVAQLEAAIGTRGSVMLGRLVLSPIGSASLDSVEIRDAEGEIVFASGPIRAKYVVWTLLDRELRLEMFSIERPQAHLVQDQRGGWNVGRLFSDTLARPTEEPKQSRPWTLTLDSLEVTRGLVTVSGPDSLPTLPLRTSRYADLQLVLGRSQYALGTSSGELLVHVLSADIASPPVLLRQASGRIVLHADSVEFDLKSVQLRDTRGSLTGSIGWGVPDADVRLALLLRADTLALSDIAWITDLIPTDGGGSAVVRIMNGPARGVTRYAIESMDASTADSRLTGRFVADVGDGVAIRDVDVTLAPMDLALIREIMGDSTMPPAPWDGVLRGRLVAPGGPLSAWRFSPSRLEYEDRRMGGSRSLITVGGMLDLVSSPMRFLPLDVVADSLDVHIAGAAFARADSMDGFVRGRVSVNGPMDNLRFDNIELIHTANAAQVSHVRGSARMASDTATSWLEAQLIVDSAHIGALAKAVTSTALRGQVSGSASAMARGDSLVMDLALEGEDAFIALTGATSTDRARFVFIGDATMETFDARRFLVGSTLPDHLITARMTIGLDGNWSGPSGPLEIIIDSISTLAGLTLRAGRATLILEPGGAFVDTLNVESDLGSISAKGRLSRDPLARDTVRFDLAIDSVALLAGFLPDSVPPEIRDSLGGRLHARGFVYGSLDTIAVGMTWTGSDLRAGPNRMAETDGDLRLTDFPGDPKGSAFMNASDIVLLGYPVTTFATQVQIRDKNRFDLAAQLAVGDTLSANTHMNLLLMPDSVRLRVDSLEASSRNVTWNLTRPAELFSDSRRLAVDTVRLRGVDGGAIEFGMDVDTAGPVRGYARLARVPMRHARFTGMIPEGLEGLVSFNAEMGGTRNAPTLTMTASLDSGFAYERPMPTFAFKGSYADREMAVDLRGRSPDREEFALTGTLPLDLALRSLSRDERMVKDDEIYLRFVADGTAIDGLGPLIPGLVDLSGRFDADILVGGFWGDYQPRGIFLLRDGRFAVPTLQTAFRDALMDISLAPDSVILHRVRFADEVAANDTASIEGAIYRNGRGGWNADVRTMAHSLRVIDNPRLAEADLSWQLRLRGPLDSLVLSGNVQVPTGNAYIADNRDVLMLEEELAEAAARRKFIPRIQALTVALGNEVRLRSPEANVQLTGEFSVSGNLEAPFLRGEVAAQRGTYRLNLGLLQRTFQVDSGTVRMNGVMRPDGRTDNPPILDIHASYLVRQADREDVKVGAHITGTTYQPRIRLYSADLGSATNETEIISYLLFGAPSFALDDPGTSAVRSATAALVPSLGGAVERALGGQIPFITDLQVTTVAGETPTDFRLNSFEGLLNSFALTAGKQLGPDAYLSLSGGVCRGENRAARSLPAWLGISTEYRPRERLSAVMSLTPGSSPCNRVGTINQIYQFGLDMYRDWRW